MKLPVKEKFKVFLSNKVRLGNHVVLAEDKEEKRFGTWIVDSYDNYHFGFYFPYRDEYKGRVNALENAFADFIKRTKQNL